MAFDALLRLFIFHQKSMKKLESSDFSPLRCFGFFAETATFDFWSGARW